MDAHVVECKEKKVEEGVDSRDKYYRNNELNIIEDTKYWDPSSRLAEKERKFVHDFLCFLKEPRESKTTYDGALERAN